MANRQEESKQRDPRSFSRVVWIVSGLLLIAGSSLLYTIHRYHRLDTASFFPGNIIVLALISINLTLVVLLVLLLSRNLVKTYFERRHKVLGAGFRSKLVTAFVVFSAIPAILLFVVASGFLNNSVDNWFSSQIEKSLKNSSEVAQMYYQSFQDTNMRHAVQIADGLKESWETTSTPRVSLADHLRSRLGESDLVSIEVFSTSGRSLGRAVKGKASSASSAGSALVKSAISGKSVTMIRSFENGDRIRCAVPIPGGGAVVTEALVPQQLVEKMRAVTGSVEEFRQNKAFKNPIKALYLTFFGIITAVILFSATWFGFYIARSITVPIHKLAEGTRAVASGNLDFVIDAKSSDEIGTLIDSFNVMTRDLKVSKSSVEEANRSLQASNIELEGRRAYIETVLENIGTGVLSIGRDGRIAAFNRSAERILNLSATEIRGRDVVEVLDAAGSGILASLVSRVLGPREAPIEEQVKIEISRRPITLRVSASPLRSSTGDVIGAVLVFDDLSDLIKAQQVAAWQEVARKIAHEIKNPLTPIQLSAQRLQKKFSERSEDFDKVFEEAMQTIIREVAGLKTLVDEFSGFARMPPPQPAAHDIHDILKEVVSLYRTAHRDLEVGMTHDSVIPLIKVDRDQIRRVFVNLFENAVEAMKRRGRMDVRTEYLKDEGVVRIEIADYGPGIDPQDMDKLFLPYFSRKQAGSGLGLAIVNRIVSDHNGQIKVVPNKPRGSRFVLELPAGI